MKHALSLLITVFTLVVLSGSGLCNSGMPKADAGKLPLDNPNLAPTTMQTERVTGQAMVDKLSNAVNNEYVIGAEDVLDITVWRNPDLSRQVQVRPDGRFSMPIIRDVVAVGKTPTKLAEEMTNKLKIYVQNPVVAVSVKDVGAGIAKN